MVLLGGLLRKLMWKFGVLMGRYCKELDDCCMLLCVFRSLYFFLKLPDIEGLCFAFTAKIADEMHYPSFFRPQDLTSHHPRWWQSNHPQVWSNIFHFCFVAPLIESSQHPVASAARKSKKLIERFHPFVEKQLRKPGCLDESFFFWNDCVAKNLENR